MSFVAVGGQPARALGGASRACGRWRSLDVSVFGLARAFAGGISRA